MKRALQCAIGLIFAVGSASCGRNSSAEGRGTITVEGTAQLKFQTAVAKVFGTCRRSVVVHREDLGIGSSEFNSRRLSEIFAFRAEIKDRGVVVYGCNTAAPGDPAFIKQPNGLAPLMKAARVLDEANGLSAADLARLVAWIYQDFGSPIDAHAARVQSDDAGAVLSYLARPSDGPHSGMTMKVTVKVDADFTTHVSAEEVRSD